jgi:hypothetical protein
MAIVLNYDWGYEYDQSGYLDTWKDTKVRSTCDSAAAAVPSGGDYWGREPVKIGEERVVPFANKPAGAIVSDTKWDVT